MKLLVITQKVDRNDPVLGFFHQWLFKLSFQFEKVEVVCLQKGEYDLPKNVQVFSLGKESGQNKFKYIFNFFKICFFQSLKYDAVFVHMNQEYVLLGGWFWKIFGKKIFLWRNHPKGNLFTYLAVWLVDQVFCTSPYSFTNYSFTKLFKKTILMPVGIDVEQFADNESISRENKILSLGRISPIKNIHLMIEAVKILKERGVSFVLDIVGDPVNPEDVEYKNQLINKSQGLPVNFLPGVPNKMTPEIYRGHEIFINLTPSGSFDKTILESA